MLKLAKNVTLRMCPTSWSSGERLKVLVVALRIRFDVAAVVVVAVAVVT